MRKFVTLSVLVSLALAACGGGGTRNQTKEEAMRSIAIQYCDWELRCGSITEPYFDACVEMYVSDFCARAVCSDETVATVNELDDVLQCIAEAGCGAFTCDILL